MKILVLCKRQYTGRDLLDDNYGRLFEIPEALCRQGHLVKGITLSYRKRSVGRHKKFRVEWLSVNGKPFSIKGSFIFYKQIMDTIEDFSPDIVWCSSDVWHIAIGGAACISTNTKFVIDMYDNYESFWLTKLPFMKSILRYMCRKSNGITTASSTLAQLVTTSYKLKDIPIQIIGNAINPSQFYPMDKAECRQRLNLPPSATLIGTAGALNSSRGIRTLFASFDTLKKKNHNLYLVVAGPRDNSFADLTSERIIDLGVLPTHMIPIVLNSLDIAVICNKNSSFGRFCYPQKYEEITACNINLVAADVGEISVLLKENPNHLFTPQSEKDLTQKIEQALEISDAFPKLRSHTWDERSMQLAEFLKSV